MVVLFWVSTGLRRDNATCIQPLQNFLHAKRGFSVEQHKIAGANECLFDPTRKCMNGISVIDSIAETLTPTPILYAQKLLKASKALQVCRFKPNWTVAEKRNVYRDFRYTKSRNNRN